MQPLISLYEREPVPMKTLTAPLAHAYAGGLMFPEPVHSRPYMIANFVETLDGIVSYNTPGLTGGGLISGEKEQDKMVMGLLRACADAVIFGSSSLYYDANHPRTPAYIYRPFSQEYDALRIVRGRTERYPLTVIVTASGELNLSDKTFHTPGLRVLIATSERGQARLAAQDTPEGTELRVVPSGPDGIMPESVLTLLFNEYRVRLALYEGGPTLLSSFLAQRLIDELFLTFAPQIAGQGVGMERLPLVKGHTFLPNDAPWATLLSVKQADSHLLLRYRFNEDRTEG